MAYVFFDSGYVPCGFLIVKDNGDPYSEQDTVLIQTDWDFPPVAQRMGFTLKSDHELCKENCCETDGTVNCNICGKSCSDFISEAYDYINDHEGETFEELDEYFYDC